MKRRAILLILVIGIVWSSLCGMSTNLDRINSLLMSTYTVGSHMKFGSYEQDNNTKNGAEPIEWVVVDKNGDRLLLVSRYVLDAKRFNDCWAEITWDDSSIRSWLNDSFYYSAFNSTERQKICLVSVDAQKNPYYSSLPTGSGTFDHVFLLSVKEAEKYFSNQNKRMTTATDYARRQGAFISTSYYVDGRGCAWWWLRSPGGYQGTGYKSYAAIIDGSGSVSGHEVYNSGYDGSIGGIRPAIWIKPV